MSRIHQALKKAEAERQAAGPAPSAARASLVSTDRDVPAARALRHLPERGLPGVRFSRAGEVVLRRTYAEIEHLCSENLDAAVGAPEPLRVILVTSEDETIDAAPAALALAAALEERTRVRVAVLGRGVAGLFEANAPAVQGPEEVSEAAPLPIRRTPLEGLFFVPVANSVASSVANTAASSPADLASREGGSDGDTAPGVARLLEYCQVVVLAADAPAPGDRRVPLLAPLARAVVLVTRHPETARERTSRSWVVPGAPLYEIPELPMGGGRAPAARGGVRGPGSGGSEPSGDRP